MYMDDQFVVKIKVCNEKYIYCITYSPLGKFDVSYAGLQLMILAPTLSLIQENPATLLISIERLLCTCTSSSGKEMDNIVMVYRQH